MLADLWFKAYKQTHFDILPPDLLNYRGRNSFLLRMFTKIQDLKTIVALEASVAIIEPPRKTELCSTAQEDDHAENVKTHAHNSESARFHRDKKSSTGEIEQFFLALAAQNRGIGKALQKAEEELKLSSTEPFSKMFLHQVVGNAVALCFYDKCGWKHDDLPFDLEVEVLKDGKSEEAKLSVSKFRKCIFLYF